MTFKEESRIRQAQQYLVEYKSMQFKRTSAMTLNSQAYNKLAAAQVKMERSMLNIIYRNRERNIWVREKTKVKEVTEQVRRRSGPVRAPQQNKR